MWCTWYWARDAHRKLVTGSQQTARQIYYHSGSLPRLQHPNASTVKAGRVQSNLSLFVPVLPGHLKSQACIVPFLWLASVMQKIRYSFVQNILCFVIYLFCFLPKLARNSRIVTHFCKLSWHFGQWKAKQKDWRETPHPHFSQGSASPGVMLKGHGRLRPTWHWFLRSPAPATGYHCLWFFWCGRSAPRRGKKRERTVSS